MPSNAMQLSMQQEKYKVYQDLILFNAENKQHILYFNTLCILVLQKKNIMHYQHMSNTTNIYNICNKFCAVTGCAHPKQNVKFLFIHI